MNRSILLFYLALLCLATPATAGEFPGIAEYQAGKHQQAIAIWTPLAEKGDATAQLLLAAHLAQDPSQRERAIHWYEQAAKQGLPLAQFNLAKLYSQGAEKHGRNDKLALHWFRLAAEHGLAEAQNSLATLLSQGTGVKKDLQEAVQWYVKAANQGHTGAQLNLAIMHMEGKGVMKSEVQAVKWLRHAAKGGNKIAQKMLAKAYTQGWLNLPRDPQKARYWLQQSKLQH